MPQQAAGITAAAGCRQPTGSGGLTWSETEVKFHPSTGDVDFEFPSTNNAAFDRIELKSSGSHPEITVRS
jgi:hypothetical protein